VATFDWHSTMHPDDAQTITDAVVTANVRQEAFAVTGRYRRTDGAFRTFTTTARPHFSAAGEFLGMIGVNVDITERDADGNLYVAVFGQGDVTVLSPAGEVVKRYPVGGSYPTNLVFGASGERSIYVTEAETGTVRKLEVGTDGFPLYA